MDSNQKFCHDKENSLLYNIEGRLSPDKADYQKVTDMNYEPAYFSFPATFRNKLLERERYRSDKEMNHVFRNFVNQEKAVDQTDINMDLELAHASNPTTYRDRHIDKENYLFKNERESIEYPKKILNIKKSQTRTVNQITFLCQRNSEIIF